MDIHLHRILLDNNFRFCYKEQTYQFKCIFVLRVTLLVLEAEHVIIENKIYNVTLFLMNFCR